MSKSNKPTISDKELDDFFEDKHRVSDAHQNLGDASSPKALDDKILAMAKDRISQPEKQPGFNRRPHAIAASVLICITVGLFTLDRQSPVMDLMNQKASDSNTGNTVDVELFDSAEVSSLEAATAKVRGRAAEEQEAMASEPGRFNLDEAVAPQLRQENSDSISVDRDENTTPGPGATAVNMNQAGARVEQGDTEYRNNQTSWITEINRLHIEREFEQANYESDLFRQAYPQTDLEEALERLVSDEF